jgi:CheY-like chemotaxis protein
LAAEPFALLEASSGEEALDFISADSAIDLIMLDIMMPGVSGFEVCERIRQHTGPAHLPILFITSKDMADDMCRGFYAGANGYAIKPINKPTILKLIYQQLSWVDNTALEEHAGVELYEIFRSLILTFTPQQTPVDRMAELVVAFTQGFAAIKVFGIWRLRVGQFEPLYADPGCPIKPVHGTQKTRKLTQLIKSMDQQRLLTPLNDGDLENLLDYLPVQAVREWVILPLVYEGKILGGIVLGAADAWAKHDLTLFTEAKPFCVAALRPLLLTADS